MSKLKSLSIDALEDIKKVGVEISDDIGDGLNKIFKNKGFEAAGIGPIDYLDDIGNIIKVDTSDIPPLNDIQNNYNKIVNGGEGIEGVSKADFTGKLRGENITLKNVKTEEISYIKRDTIELNKLRSDFNTSVRKNFLEELSKNVEYLEEAGFTEKDILKMQNGRVPDGWQVHHKLPLDDSGTNSFDNLLLIKNEPYHKVITNYQNSFSKQLKVGEVRKVNWPIPEGDIYPKKH